MLKWILLVMIVFWVCLILVTGINIYNQAQVVRYQNKILNYYRLISEVEDVFQAARDSLMNEIEKLDQKRKSAEKSFPLKDKVMNWLLLRIAVVILTLCTLVVAWLYFRQKAVE